MVNPNSSRGKDDVQAQAAFEESDMEVETVKTDGDVDKIKKGA